MKIRRRNEPDELTAERLLSGSFPPDDIPSEFSGLARIFEAARAVETEAADADAALIEKMSDVIESSTPTTARSFAKQGRLIMPRLRRLKLSALGAVAALSLMTGLAFAGSLPDQAQNAASKAFQFFGFDSVPSATVPDEASARSENASNSDGATAGERNGGASSSEISTKAQEVDTFEEGSSLADEASGGASEPGTSTAENWVPEETPSSGEEGQSTGEDYKSTGEDAASEGSGNQDRNPR